MQFIYRYVARKLSHPYVTNALMKRDAPAWMVGMRHVAFDAGAAALWIQMRAVSCVQAALSRGRPFSASMIGLFTAC